MAKAVSKTKKLKAEKMSSLSGLNEELNTASGKLLETTGAMQSFVRALQTSGFREYVDYMGRPWWTFWFNFMVGIARGLGFVIGATVVVAIVVYVVTEWLINLPFIGDFFGFFSEVLSPENIERVRSGQLFESISEMLDSFKTVPLDSATDMRNGVLKP